MVAASHGPAGMPDEAAGESIEHFFWIVVTNGGKLEPTKSRISSSGCGTS